MQIIKSGNRALFALIISFSITACGGSSSNLASSSSVASSEPTSSSSSIASSEPVFSSSSAASSEPASSSSSTASSEPASSSSSAVSSEPVSSSSSAASSEPVSSSSSVASSEPVSSSSSVASSTPSSSSSVASSSSSSEDELLATVLITSLGNGSVKFSITLPEQKEAVHLFARRNGAQDHVITDLQGLPDAVIDNLDGTYTYQNIRTEAYTDGDLIEARVYTFSAPPAGSGQIFYPGPSDNDWTAVTYDSTGTPPSSSSAASSAASSSSSGADPLEIVLITALGNGSVKFSITLPEQKEAVHLFARRNGAQDHVITDLQGLPDAVIDNLDGTYTYQNIRTEAYTDGDLIEARVYTFSAPPAGSGQIFYPGPSDNDWTSTTYGGSGIPVSSSSASSSSAGHSSSSSSSASYSSTPNAGVSIPGDTIITLFSEGTQLEDDIQFETDDALITRFSDRARDRHAKESQYQAYDHYLNFYWEHRTAAIEIVDYVAKGGSEIQMNVRTQWRLSNTEAENRWFYRGVGTVAEFCDNGTMESIDELNYYKVRNHNCREGRAIQIGDKLEFELSQFLGDGVPNGRTAYYGTTFLYIVGEGIVPWDVGGATPMGGIKDSVKIPEKAWLGGRTTLHEATSNESQNHFMQMATNLGYENAQPFVLGRRILHTSFIHGTHDEQPVSGGNPVFAEMVGKVGPRYVSESCSDCHVRNGRAPVAPTGQPLNKWVFKVADENGNPHPYLGRVLQPQTVGSAESEGEVFIASWTEEGGLRSPNYEFTGITPEKFSARITPQLVGMGLLEAIPETAILALEDPDDLSGNGISGRANRVIDPEAGEVRLGRFGWKAGTTSVRHQIAGAFNTDMGVMTSILPTPDCGSEQTDCATGNTPLTGQNLDNLVKYVSLLGVRPQRDYDDLAVQHGEVLFTDIGCTSCHTPSFQTSPYHPLAELRDQTISPYTDLLLHDMGPGLADDLGEGDASGAEWRTTPLWGLGLSACVAGGVTNPSGQQGDEVCTPEHSYLHDGRARTIEEAILWHGGEGQLSNDNYQALSSGDQQDLLRFLESL